MADENQITLNIPEGMSQEDAQKILTNLLTKNKRKGKTGVDQIFSRIEKGPDKEIRVSIDFYKGRELNSVREWFTDPDSGELRPGRGCTFDYEAIDEIIEGLIKMKEFLANPPPEGEEEPSG